MTHLSPEEILRVAEEGSEAPHLRECVACANAVVDEVRLRRAIRSAGRRYGAPDALRDRVMRDLGSGGRRWRGWLPLAAAAVLVVAAITLVVLRRPPPDARELIDLHVTMLASPNPVDVLSSDRHTVKPWFEGRIPFAFDIPELGATPYRLVGGRVVYWQRRPGALLQLVRGNHRISLFIFGETAQPGSGTEEGFRLRAWRSGGLIYVLVADVPDEELAKIEVLFQGR